MYSACEKKCVGYFFWGFLGDKKYDYKLNELSTPDGNAFYSWSIINAFAELKDAPVYCMGQKRDAVGFANKREELFSAFAKEDRTTACFRYHECIPVNMEINRENLYKCWDVRKQILDYVLIEWRWSIQGRNEYVELPDGSLVISKDWQPDLFIMNCLIDWCNENNIKFVVFDLDYKLTTADIKEKNIKYVIELGNKWKDFKQVKSMQVMIPFDFSHINDLPIKKNLSGNLLYVGNRYERDWCIDKYIPNDFDDCMIFGNWKESGRDSESRWQGIKFGHRLQTSEMYEQYSNYATTILLAKKEYCEMEFMTARIIEAVFYGCLPLFIEEYGSNLIQTYAGELADSLTVRNEKEVRWTAEFYRSVPERRAEMIKYLRRHLRFMDSKFFAADVDMLMRS